MVGFSKFNGMTYPLFNCLLDPHSLKYIPGSRNPNGVRVWLDRRVSEGFDGKSIKAMLRMSEEELSQVIILLESSVSSVIN